MNSLTKLNNRAHFVSKPKPSGGFIPSKATLYKATPVSKVSLLCAAQPSVLHRTFQSDSKALRKRESQDWNAVNMNNLMPIDLFDTLVDWNPFLASFPSTRLSRGTAMEWRPKADIEETAEAYQIHADLPGVTKENLKVTLVDNVLTVKGERKEEKEEEDKDKKVSRKERMYGSFLRKFVLPEEVDQKGVKASFKDGVLNIAVPKVPKPQKEQTEVNIE